MNLTKLDWNNFLLVHKMLVLYKCMGVEFNDNNNFYKYNSYIFRSRSFIPNRYQGYKSA